MRKMFIDLYDDGQGEIFPYDSPLLAHRLFGSYMGPLPMLCARTDSSLSFRGHQYLSSEARACSKAVEITSGVLLAYYPDTDRWRLHNYDSDYLDLDGEPIELVFREPHTLMIVTDRGSIYLDSHRGSMQKKWMLIDSNIRLNPSDTIHSSNWPECLVNNGPLNTSSANFFTYIDSKGRQRSFALYFDECSTTYPWTLRKVDCNQKVSTDIDNGVGRFIRNVNQAYFYDDTLLVVDDNFKLRAKMAVPSHLTNEAIHCSASDSWVTDFRIAVLCKAINGTVLLISRKPSDSYDLSAECDSIAPEVMVDLPYDNASYCSKLKTTVTNADATIYFEVSDGHFCAENGPTRALAAVEVPSGLVFSPKQHFYSSNIEHLRDRSKKIYDPNGRYVEGTFCDNGVQFIYQFDSHDYFFINSVVASNYWEWYCNGSPQGTCIEGIGFTLTNKTNAPATISSLLVEVLGEGSTDGHSGTTKVPFYRREHSINVTLQPNESIPVDRINLSAPARIGSNKCWISVTAR
ncbi:MAG: hypothetical protein IPI29_14370 [Ignavibacteria bacterium]|nr:hypothetical protein [Ignavibacteria bacterium]